MSAMKTENWDKQSVPTLQVAARIEQGRHSSSSVFKKKSCGKERLTVLDNLIAFLLLYVPNSFVIRELAEFFAFLAPSDHLFLRCLSAALE